MRCYRFYLYILWSQPTTKTNMHLPFRTFVLSFSLRASCTRTRYLTNQIYIRILLSTQYSCNKSLLMAICNRFLFSICQMDIKLWSSFAFNLHHPLIARIYLQSYTISIWLWCKRPVRFDSFVGFAVNCTIYLLKVPTVCAQCTMDAKRSLMVL